MILMDATGMKVVGEGEWKVRMDGKSKKRKWIRGCRHKTQAQIIIHRMCIAAKNEAVLFAYLVAIPRHCLKSRNAFSTKCLAL